MNTFVVVHEPDCETTDILGVATNPVSAFQIMQIFVDKLREKYEKDAETRPQREEAIENRLCNVKECLFFLEFEADTLNLGRKFRKSYFELCD